MIAPALVGGLGNQLYQIAAIYSHARKHGREFVLNFNKTLKPSQGKSPRAYHEALYRNIKVVDRFFPFTYKAHSFEYPDLANGFKYADLPLIDAEHDVMYSGLFISWKYFEEYKAEVVKLLSFKDAIVSKTTSWIEELKERHAVSRIVGVHIRRGDFINNPYKLTIVKGDYYERAKKCFDANDTLFVYTTCSPEEVREEFSFDGKNILMSEGFELQDLCFLSQCDSLIMANSSFSAWAAYLGKTKEKVICPSQWFDETGPKEHDIVDPDWIKM